MLHFALDMVADSESWQDMRKQRQRIDEQQIMHYFVQILQALSALVKGSVPNPGRFGCGMAAWDADRLFSTSTGSASFTET